MEQTQAKFEGWAVVEMMGHQREIGFVTTEYFGGAALFRVDRPEIPEREYELERPGYASGTWVPKGTKVRRAALAAKSRLVAPGSLYAMNPCTEEAALKEIERALGQELILVDVPKREALPAAPNPDDEPFICASCVDGDHDHCVNATEEGDDRDCECDCRSDIDEGSNE